MMSCIMGVRTCDACDVLHEWNYCVNYVNQRYLDTLFCTQRCWAVYVTCFYHKHSHTNKWLLFTCCWAHCCLSMSWRQSSTILINPSIVHIDAICQLECTSRNVWIAENSHLFIPSKLWLLVINYLVTINKHYCTQHLCNKI